MQLKPSFGHLSVFVLFLVLFSFAVSGIASLYIVSDLGGSSMITSYMVAYFGFGNAITIPLSMALRDRLGYVTILRTCLVGFTLATLLVGLSPTYPVLVFCRFLQGATSGPIFVMSASLFTHFAEAKVKDRLISYIIIIFIVTPIIGSCMGGAIAYLWQWRWIFHTGFLMMAITTVFYWRGIAPYRIPLEKKPFDGVGYLFYCLAILGIGTYITMGQELDWLRSPFLVTCLVTGVISFLFFIPWTYLHPHPILQLRMLGCFYLCLGVILIGLLFSTYYGMVSLVSLWLKLYVNYSVLWINVTLALMVVTAFVVMFSMWAAKHRGSFRTLMMASALLLFCCIYSMQFNQDVNFFRICISRIAAGLAFALFLPPLFHLCTMEFKGDGPLHAITYFQMFRTISSSIGSSFYITLWQRRTYFYFSRLGSRLTATDPETKTFIAKAKEFGLNSSETIGELNRDLMRQSVSLALDDCFYFMAWIVGIGSVILISVYLVKVVLEKNGCQIMNRS